MRGQASCSVCREIILWGEWPGDHLQLILFGSCLYSGSVCSTSPPPPTITPHHKNEHQAFFCTLLEGLQRTGSPPPPPPPLVLTLTMPQTDLKVYKKVECLILLLWVIQGEEIEYEQKKSENPKHFTCRRISGPGRREQVKLRVLIWKILGSAN